MENLKKQLLPVLYLLCLFPGSLTAKNFVILDFETPATGSAPAAGQPLSPDANAWNLQPSFDNHFGSGNFFEISSTSSHSGSNSLKYTYEARNGFCNTCGIKNIGHLKGLDGVNYYVADTGEDLTQEFYPPKLIDPSGPSDGPTFTPNGPHASIGKTILNKTRGYTKYTVVAVENENATNDKLIVKKVRDGIGSFAGQPDIFNSRDEVLIARQCGVDGIIGKAGGLFEVSRRSDCDGAISWFGNIAPNAQPSGTSIFRRVYLKAEIVGLPSGHKLNYMRLMRGADSDISASIVAIASNVDGNMEPHLTGFGPTPISGKGRYEPGNGLPAGLKFERGIWYYIEQEYQAETYTMSSHINDGTVIVDSYTGDGNGAYRLWFGKSGEEPDRDNPTLEVENIPLPPMLGGDGTHMSLWGNQGHDLHTRGSWYMDDIVVSDTYIGPVATPDGSNTRAPSAPVAAQ